MPQLLTDIDLDEVSLVDRPACPEAHVLLFKRDGGEVVDKAGAWDESRHPRGEHGRWSDGPGGVAAATSSPEGHRRQQDQHAGYRALTSGVIPEHRNEPLGHVEGGLWGSAVGGVAGAALGHRAGPVASRAGRAIQRSGGWFGQAAGTAIGRTLGAAAEVAGRGRFRGATGAGGRLGAAIGRRVGAGLGAAVGGTLRFGGNVYREAAGRHGALLGGAVGAAAGLVPGAQLGGAIGRTVDTFSARRVEKMSDGADSGQDEVLVLKADDSDPGVVVSKAGMAMMDDHASDAMGEAQQLVQALHQSVVSVVEQAQSPDEGMAALNDTFEQFWSALQDLLGGYDGDDAQPGDPGALAKCFAAGLAAVVPTSGTQTEELSKMADATNNDALLERLAKAEMKPEELTYYNNLTGDAKAEFAKADPAKRPELMAKAGVTKSAAGDDRDKLIAEQGAIIKSLSEQVHALAKKDDLAAVEADLKAVGQPVEKAEHYLTIKKSSPDAYQAVMDGFKASHEQITKGGLFKEAGAAGPGLANSGSAAIIAKAGKNDPEAIAKALAEDPSLYDAYLREQGR